MKAEREQGRRPGGLIALVGFFAFGAAVASLTFIMLLVPGAWANTIWRLKPSAQTDFHELGAGAPVLMFCVAVACAGAAIGLWRLRRWGYRLAIGVLVINLIGDLANGLLRHDWRTLVGLPIGGGMLIYLATSARRFPAAG